MLSFFQTTPRSLADTYSHTMEALIRDEMRQGCDLVIASQWSMAAYYHLYQHCPAIFEEVELGNLESKRASAQTRMGRLRHTLPLLKLRLYFRQMLQHFRACTVVSSIEAERVRSMAPRFGAIQTIPNGVDLDGYTSVTEQLSAAPKQASTLIFTGSFRYDANHDAMQWFVGEVMPRVRDVMPKVQLTITGDHAGLPLPSTDHVTLTGYVDDPRRLLAQSAISIAPLRIGGGTRLKILEAMAVRTPVVATSKGAEGLDARDGEHLLIADTPDAFAQAIFRLLRDAELRRKIADNAHELVRTRYDWRVILPRFLNLVEQVKSVQSVSSVQYV
jgi:glycosyltransferase involved in cell wall biosynthesis